MSQAQVMEVLEQNKTEWMTSAEIKDMVGLGVGSVICNLQRLRMAGFIKFKYIRNHNKYFYKHKRYMK